MTPPTDVNLTQLSQVGVATLALLVMLVFLLIVFYTLRFIITPLVNNRKKNGTPGASSSGDNTDSWLVILRDLVEQIRRSVDNQTQLTRLVMQLAEGIKLEIAASEGRLLAAINKSPDSVQGKDKP